ncbi:hypothetical protein ILUMI_18721 [Ignelater luminosus]|uniref:HTH psq-type domain-containing protein n=1 Tax=Ignelater luminosus TaxID=2038154 RepID=A0A8K0CKR6_IGNLU|nr:hypothetical protein ILUMI_18721 [Ignelater luminosus]
MNPVANVLRGPTSLRTAANAFDIKKSTLHDIVKKAKLQETLSDSKNESSEEESYGLSKYATRQVPRVIVETGKRVVGQCVSTERGTTVTFCGIILAAGGTIPPCIYISSCTNEKPPFTWLSSREIGVGDHRNICKIIGTHTKSHEKFTNMFNHKTHVSVDANNYAGNNGIALLSSPPHCTQRCNP